MENKKPDKNIEQKKSVKTDFGPIFFYFLASFIFLFLISGFIYYQYSTQIALIVKIQQAVTTASGANSHPHIDAFVYREKLFAIIGEVLVVFFFLMMSLSFLAIYKYFIEPLKRLRENINNILKNNFDYKIKPGYKNAFTYFDDFLNKIIDQFHESKVAIENSNVQRGRELDKVIGKLWKENLTTNKLLEDSRVLEGQLKQEKDFVNAIISCLSESLIVTDKTGKITSFNPAAGWKLGLTQAEVADKIIDQSVPLFLDKACKTKILTEDYPTIKAIEKGKILISSLADDYFFQTKTGKKIAIIYSASPLLKDGEVIGAVTIFRDITYEKQLDDAKNSFISIASHQLRTPLTSMRWFSEMLISKDAGKLNKEQSQYIDQVYQGIERMTGLLDLLLQISRIEAGRVKVEPTPVEFRQIIDDVAAALKPLINKKKQKVAVVLKSDNFPVIAMDKEMVWQVFLNLLSNASRYAPVSGVIKVAGQIKDGMAEFSVADKGIGIPKEAQDRIFNKFYRSPNAIKHVPEGSGLGLYLVKSLVEGWGGKIWFESSKDEGTIFSFTVPLSGMEAKEGEVTLKV